jgi:hypothetical protein
MLVVEIDIIRTEAFQTGVAYAARIFRRPIDAGNALWSDPKAKLGRDHNLPARHLAQKPAEQFFVLVRAVHFRGIEKVAAQRNVSAQDAQRFRFICRAVGISHAHATEAECANVQ